MQKTRRCKQFHTLLMVLLLSTSCNEPDKSPLPTDNGAVPTPATAQLDSTTLAARLSNPPVATEQISQYIRRMFQDRDGNIWFGTEQDGVCRYDPSASHRASGRSLDYFTPVEGFSGTSVRGMAQDENGDMWFATRGGVSRFDGRGFTKYTTREGLADDQVWCLVLDRKGGCWFGTQEGVSRFDGKTFTPFPLPAADLTHFPTAVQSPKLINCMLQDKAGNIWIGSNGNGVYRYDGRILTNFSKKDGLCDDFIQSMIEDREGNLWFGTRFTGLCKYDPSASLRPGGRTFTGFSTKDGLTSKLIWTLYLDGAGTIWMAATYAGLCSFDGRTFICYAERDGLGNNAVHSFLEDATGQLWIGTGGGVYRFDPAAPLRPGGKRFTNWTKKEALGG